MDPEQTEQLRLAVLKVLEANNGRYGRPVPALQVHLRSWGFDVPRESIRNAIQYLEDKGLITEVLKGVSPENRCYRITADGIDYIATH